MSPFLGLSIVIHVLILFLYQTALFAYKLVFGFEKNTVQRITVLARDNEERLLPALVIATVILTVSGLSFFTLRASFESKPNTMDLIVNATNNVWQESTPEVEPTTIPKIPDRKPTPIIDTPPSREGNSLASSENSNL